MANPDYLYEYGALRTYVGGEIGEFWVYQTAGIFQNQAEVDEWNTAHGYKDQNVTGSLCSLWLSRVISVS